VNVAAGDIVAAAVADRSLFTLVDSSKLHIDVSISEADVAQIEEGQPVYVTIDALGMAPIDGTIDFIAPAATVVQNVTTYEARVELPRDTPSVRVGMNASVEVGVAEKHDVLVVPSSAIRTEGNKRFVRLLRVDELVDTEIHTGLSNDLETEVTAGLQEGDQIARSAIASAGSGTE
jgi:HlyD family secretion protein